MNKYLVVTEFIQHGFVFFKEGRCPDHLPSDHFYKITVVGDGEVELYGVDSPIPMEDLRIPTNDEGPGTSYRLEEDGGLTRTFGETAPIYLPTLGLDYWLQFKSNEHEK